MQKVEKILDYIKEDKTYEAQKLVIKYFKDNPGLFYYYLGLINLKREEYLQAIVCFRTARANNLNSYLLCYNLSIAYKKVNNNESASEELIESIRKYPEFLNSYTNLCSIYVEKQDYKSAYRIIKCAQATFNEDKEKLDKLFSLEKNMKEKGFIK